MLIQTAERQELYDVIAALPDDSVSAMLNYVRNLRSGQPNAETRAAMAELRAGKGETVTMDELKAMLDEIE
ncbi:MAG: type II toxin-antitoxin system RelB/DinJ family antitoxin [Synergistaceae bacterium]|nr:type II toxin-antitoxin system RelB/DinJ family antitoxin [Synergistaceae bacterium]